MQGSITVAVSFTSIRNNACRTIGLSDYWAVGLSGCRTIGPSEYKAVIIRILMGYQLTHSPGTSETSYSTHDVLRPWDQFECPANLNSHVRVVFPCMLVTDDVYPRASRSRVASLTRFVKFACPSFWSRVWFGCHREALGGHRDWFGCLLVFRHIRH